MFFRLDRANQSSAKTLSRIPPLAVEQFIIQEFFRIIAFACHEKTLMVKAGRRQTKRINFAFFLVFPNYRVSKCETFDGKKQAIGRVRINFVFSFPVLHLEYDVILETVSVFLVVQAFECSYVIKLC